MISRKRFLSLAVALVLGLALFSSPGMAAPDPDRAMKFVRAGLDSVIAVLGEENMSHDEKITKLRGLLRDDFDLATVGKFVLGVHRRGLSKEKMADYLAAFEEHVVEAYVGRLVRIVEPSVVRKVAEIVSITGTHPAGQHDIFVQMGFVREGNSPFEVNWRVRDNNGLLKVVDVQFLGVSMAMTYKQEFASVIRKRGKGVDGLITALREHATFRFAEK